MTVVAASRAASAALVTAIGLAHARLGRVVAALTEEQVAEPSRLPGWSRGHVLAHLTELAAAVTRQIEAARAGELVEVYDGGRPARDAAIEARAPESAEGHERSLRRATAGIGVLLASLAPADWDLPVRYRDAVVRTVVQAWYREVEIHTVDLDLGADSDGWSELFCDQTVEFLAPRVRAGTTLVLEASDGWTRELGTGARRVVRGARTDLVAWLAGRDPMRPVRTDDGEPLPELDPWP